jgi:hypothetical protein
VKEIEAMKRLTLHRIASSRYCCIASVAQLWFLDYYAITPFFHWG